MRSRNWSIRSKIIAMSAVPLTALFALWIFAIVATSGPAVTLLNARDAVHQLGDPGLRLIAQLQRERHFSTIYISAERPARTELARERAATDTVGAEFRKAVSGADLDEAVQSRVTDLLDRLEDVQDTRTEIDQRSITLLNAVQDFNRAIDAGFEVFSTAAVFFEERVDREVRGLIGALRGQEYLSRVDAVLAGANTEGRIDAVARETMIEDISTSRYLIASGVADMPADAQGDYSRLITHPTFIELDIMQNMLIGQSYAGGAPPVSGSRWQPTYDYVSQELRNFGTRVVDEVSQDAIPVAFSVLLWLALSGLLGLVALVLSIWVSVRVGRSIVGRLIRLRREALELASERLPSVVQRLQRGEAVDVDVETPPLEYGRDEIGQLGHAFSDVQRTAVQSAVDEANVRRGINEVFLNIARRSQTLLHRQLSLLDKMERRETEPRELEDLYRVDHLATRMRRHAEDLVILAGAAPGRGWRNPVPVIDVIRGAISEVEEYKRVDIRAVTSSALLGRAVGDVIHLLAELIENAASYSPPHTRVQVVGQVLPNGYAIEIEDRGLGMEPDAITEANRRLAEPPEFDPADSARLGLFVVAQLANRHNIRVSMRASAYGGVTAIVLVPGELVTAGPRTGSSGGPSGPEKGWNAPLVGTGTSDPARGSLAELQWQGGEELQEVPVNGNRATAQVPTPVPAVDPTGPAPSVVAPELSADGLVQRRRVKRVPQQIETEPVEDTEARSVPRNSGTAAAVPPPPRAVPRGSESAAAEEPTMVQPVRAVPRGSGPAAIDEPIDEPTVVQPLRSVPRGSEPVAAGEPDAGPGEPDEITAAMPVAATDDNLPRRVRQASLAPQLRQPMAQPSAAAPARSPEQVRTIMSALQLGTNRGRVAAARVEASTPAPQGTGNAADPDGTAFSAAATVSFPALVDVAAAREKAPSGTDTGAAGDRAGDPGENLRLEKDA
ncbi:nitrate- and nitrite sensing domain-containing protein [Actinoplanes sp. NBRC 101535]|uniref:sensor histidine kinase n=1 Tax=Actinoplanes sp. NBRC 101535 TaxID=3032196 RepID=UPI0024A308C7|nr:nitrate- and nitrite sensing domain-containing protein [Actinoplanes sp. NBRC 101535]GLY01337.1 histidine kinase [Actinoplanes sp. NBRC 101535]